MSATITPDLREARRLLGKGFKLCKLLPMQKRPEGNDWQLQPITLIDDDATGIGAMLGLNDLSSVDPDNMGPAREGLARCGFNMDAIMAAGVRTTSTRPDSGGRSTFKAVPGLKRVVFASKTHGTILELRAGQSNLQDCLPGTVYNTVDNDTGEIHGPFVQRYANGKTLDMAPDLPPDFLAWWQRMNTDLAFKREQQRLLCGEDAVLAISSDNGKELACASAYRMPFNRHNDVEHILARNDYRQDERTGRWAPPTATGTPCVRPIPGKDGLWQSDHASDALHGTFDAWVAYVTLDHNGELEAAEAAFGPELAAISMRDLAEDFQPVEDVALSDTPSTPAAFSEMEEMALRAPTQDLVATAFEKAYAGRFLYAHAFGKWLEWTGTRWVADPTSRVFELTRQLARRVNLKNSKEPTKASFYAGVLKIAQHSPRFSTIGTEFDADTDVLNTPAGVVDLRTGEMAAHSPSQRLSKITAVAPSAAGGGEFIGALYEICDDDFELMDFMQISLGAMLSGAIEEHWLLFWYGTGRNGKNLLADVVFEVLGDYAHKMPSHALMSKQHESHPTTLAALAGKRFVLSSEVPDGAFWNTSAIKELTGDGTITAHFMRQDEFTFQRTHKHLILGNHRPQVRESDAAMVSRMKLVPFNVSFAGRENSDLPRLLRAESGYILNWLIEGHLKWRKGGKRLPACKAVDSASAAYFAAQSTTSLWIEEACKRVPVDERAQSAWPKASDLYAHYSQWKKDRGESPVSQTRWGEEMQRMGFQRVKSDGYRYSGVEDIPRWEW